MTAARRPGYFTLGPVPAPARWPDVPAQPAKRTVYPPAPARPSLADRFDDLIPVNLNPKAAQAYLAAVGLFLIGLAVGSTPDFWQAAPRRFLAAWVAYGLGVAAAYVGLVRDAYPEPW